MFINLWPGVISCFMYALSTVFICIEFIRNESNWFNLLMIFIFNFGLNLNILLNGYNLRLQEELNERKN